MKHYLNLPNVLSLIRIVLVPLVLVAMHFQSQTEGFSYSFFSFLAVFFFLASAISDLFDGYYARRFGLTTTFGKFLDPLADKLMHLSVLIVLTPHVIPAWWVILLMSRELSITALRSMAAAEGVIIPADYWGKKKTALLNSALTGFLMPPFLWGLDFRTMAWVFLILGSLVSLGSGLNYTWQFVRVVRGIRGR